MKGKDRESILIYELFKLKVNQQRIELSLARGRATQLREFWKCGAFHKDKQRLANSVLGVFGLDCAQLNIIITQQQVIEPCLLWVEDHITTFTHDDFRQILQVC